MNQTQLRKHIRCTTHQDEHQSVTQLLHSNPFSKQARQQILDESRDLVTACRRDQGSGGALDAFLLEFGLSNAEGVALMCLAEALLRVPDALTADRLIAEKIQSGDWQDHRGQSQSLFVNASTWGLMLTGHLVSLDKAITEDTGNWVKRLTSTLGEPVIRAAVMQAMKIMGGQYVLGRTIEESLKRGAKQNHKNSRFSFDMLGEGARTEADAQRYMYAYATAIDTIGGANTSGSNVYSGNGISVKLSALHPRYFYSQHKKVIKELLPRIKQLCLQAKKHAIGLSIDAEESYRLDISLDIFQALACDSDLQGWQGLGFVLQAYQKRAPAVAKWLIGLAEQTQRRLMVRLVKGAYWDAEIKHAQELGLEGYPVFTRKANTDLCYQQCAALLLDAQAQIYPQFATHNAYTVSMIMALAGDREFEFQRLHGMGHALYDQARRRHGKAMVVRVYAPVGNHKDLLPYLVRRLLENGANSSFVNRFLDAQTPVEELLQDTRTEVRQSFPYQHRQIVLPRNLFTAAGEPRNNASGIDIDCPLETQTLLQAVERISNQSLQAHSIIDGHAVETGLKTRFSPADNRQQIGHSSAAHNEDIQRAVTSALTQYPIWSALGAERRADIIDKAADLLERDCAELIAVISLEAGRTIGDGISEVREAIDFCRYYALQARLLAKDSTLSYTGRGVFLCISPWNFPLAIFVGQVVAALVAGNTVIAKPADQTPAIAGYAVRLLHAAGVPGEVLQLVLGSGSQIGKLLVPDHRIAGIAFTGSTATAQTINRQLAERHGGPIPLIAETGGQNCMIVDSTALPEQVVDDVITSAFLSAGQRCSALRVLFIQSDIADHCLEMLAGAMACIEMGDPRLLSTDLGPVIDRSAQQQLQAHINLMDSKSDKQSKLLATIEPPEQCGHGSFIAPYIIEIDSIDQLTEEVFGPVLHVIRYRADQLSQVLQQINQTGYGLTLGVHSRIQAFADTVFRNSIAGNTYINRNMVGAVVGVNPFGGRGLSGTGPKAGGPNYLLRFSATSSSIQCNQPYQIDLSSDYEIDPVLIDNAVAALSGWYGVSIAHRLIKLKQCNPQTVSRFDAVAIEKLSTPVRLPGPTGEDNQLSLLARGAMVLVIRQQDPIDVAEQQIICALLCGCSIIMAADRSHWLALEQIRERYQQAEIPASLMQLVPIEGLNSIVQNNRIEGVIANSLNTDSSGLRQMMANRTGSIIPLIEWSEDSTGYHYHWLLWFLSERTKTENLVARGGNTQLFNLQD